MLFLHRISLDIPTGYIGDLSQSYFQAHEVLTLAAPKRILYDLAEGTSIWVADLGIPQEVYEHFSVEPFPFQHNPLI